MEQSNSAANIKLIKVDFANSSNVNAWNKQILCAVSVCRAGVSEGVLDSTNSKVKFLVSYKDMFIFMSLAVSDGAVVNNRYNTASVSGI